MAEDPTREVVPASLDARFGVARRDITPPVGIYARMWGCARHDVAEGVHRPLCATVLAIRPLGGGLPLVLVTLDLGWWRCAEDEFLVRGPVLDCLSLDAPRLMLHTVHTHAGPSTSLAAKNKPGGHWIPGYLDHVRAMVVEAAGEAIGSAQSATLSWTTARCGLAANRDLPDPRGGGMLCGLNPDRPADDTVVIGRVTTGTDRVLATLVNYACHPTTLGGENRRISPDYIGAMRETVERATGLAPCLFFQGASGDLGPRRGFEAETEIADLNGRQLGYAVLSGLAGMLPHRQSLVFTGDQPSGAPLGLWRTTDFAPSTDCRAVTAYVDLPMRDDLPTTEQLAEQIQGCRDRVMRERLERAYHRRQAFGDADRFPMPLWAWRLGDAFVVATPAEAYSRLQTQLRGRFPQRVIVVMNMVNGYCSYLPTPDAYRAGVYQAEVSLLAPGSLERIVQACEQALCRLGAEPPATGGTA